MSTTLSQPCVYVDDVFIRESTDGQAFKVGERNGHRWCHMWCDPGAEDLLHAVARQVGMRPEWFQRKPGFPHYDLTPSRRAEALTAGAVYLPLRQWLAARRTPPSPCHPPPFPFDEESSQRANALWGANCGPHALSVALACPLEDAGDLLPAFRQKRYTTPTMLEAALSTARVPFRCLKWLRTKQLRSGICRVQFEGEWLNPGHPPGKAYRHTHWVAANRGSAFCTLMPELRWYTADDWRSEIDAFCRDRGYPGWHITHHYVLPHLKSSALLADTPCTA